MELSILENLSSGIIFIDKDRKIKYLNRLAKEMLKDKKGGGLLLWHLLSL